MTKTEQIRIVKERYQVPQTVAEFLALILFLGEHLETKEEVIEFLEKLEVLGKGINL